MKAILAILALLFYLAAAASAQVASLAKQFQDAIRLMADKGQYLEAAKQFEQIAKGNDRTLAAGALYYAGYCYEQLGNAMARATYDRLIREFKDQAEIAAKAGKRLAALESAERAALDAGKKSQRVVLSEREAAEDRKSVV